MTARCSSAFTGMVGMSEGIPKVKVEYLSADKKGPDGKAQRLRSYVLTSALSYDEAIMQARQRAQHDGYEVLSANFRATETGALNGIAVVVKEARR